MSSPIAVAQISLARAAGDPLLVANDGSTPLRLIAYREPTILPSTRYGPPSDHIHDGDDPLSTKLQMTMLNFDLATRDAASETASRAAYADLVAVIQRLRYAVIVTPFGAPPETWQGRPGTASPVSDRNYVDVANHDPIWSIAVPCYPVRSV